jgi:raffinose/stachyose/melibiose transport system permease protein
MTQPLPGVTTKTEGGLAAPVMRNKGVWGRLRPRTRRQWHVFLFVLPALTLILAFYFLPVLMNIYLSFTDWSTYKSAINFIGLRNFTDLAQTGELGGALSVTLRYAIFVMIAENLVALTLALALEESTLLNVVLRSIFFIPVLISTLAAGYVFKGVFEPTGVLNNMLNLFAVPLGMAPIKTGWLGSVDITLYVIAFVHAWKFGGIHMFVYLAGLKAIPHELLESARVEGANAWQVFRYVRVPLLGPAFTFNITLTLIGALSIFDIILAMTRGGPGRASEVMNLAVWRQFGAGAFAYSAAIGTVLFIVVITVAIPLIVYLRRREVSL